MRKFIFLLLSIILCHSVSSQLSVLKLVGKNSKEHRIGFGAFYSIDIPIDETGTKCVILELIDFGYFPAKQSSYMDEAGYASFKIGYRYIFSEESKTGFYVEPQAGYGLTAIGNEDPEPGKGFALAMIAGYSLEVGKGGNNFTFGLKYETCFANNDKELSSVGFRIAFSYRLFRKKDY